MLRLLRTYAVWWYPALCLLIVWLTRDHVFFWDTVQLASKQAHWFHENDFRYLLLPDVIDSGHPPGFGMYLALWWWLFGKTLFVSHLAMLPWLLLLGWALFRLGDHFGRPELSPLLVLLALADPVVAGQMVLVSPDLALTALFGTGLVGILGKRPWLKVAAALGLAVISSRGMMTVVVLYLFELLAGPERWFFKKDNRQWWLAIIRKALPYVPSGLVALAYLTHHYLVKGWIGYHPDSPWAPGFERVDFGGFLWNVGLLGWRLLDFGRVFLWACLGLLIFKNWEQIKEDTTVRRLSGLVLLAVPILCATFLLYQYLQNHRYLLPLLLAVTLLFYRLLVLAPVRWRYGAFALAFAGLLTGNLWIYPDPISQGWDATLAHWPYYELREKAIDYIQKENIPLDSVGTAFPEIGPLSYRDLSGGEIGFKEKDLASDSYVLYSNVMNDFSNEELKRLKNDWRVIWERRGGGVRVVLYEKSNE